MDTTSLKYTESQYGNHELQRVGVWEFPQDIPRDDKGYWIIYIHGGAWRDPRILLQTFLPSIRGLLRSGAASDQRIGGFAAIDYRLSAHPQFPQDPATVPPELYRDARHPDHILDARAALAHLQERYGFGDRYVLIGHSAGATMAFQVAMGAAALGDGTEIPEKVMPPRALVGISGIYELTGIDERHNGDYTSFIAGAFGEDKKVWDDSMPACFKGSFKDVLGSTHILLVWSKEDSLIDEPEIDTMKERLEKEGLEVGINKEVKGDHDFIWEDGKQVAKLIKEVLDRLSQ